VLGEMVDARFLSPADADVAKHEPITMIADKDDFNWVIAPYFVEHVRKYVYHKYGREELFGKGLQIHTTLDLQMQLAAERAVRNGLEELSRRLGFSGPIEKVPPEARVEFLRFPRVYPEIAGIEHMPADVYLGQPYRGLVAISRNGKISVAIGDKFYDLDRADVERIRRWVVRDRSRKVLAGDVIPVRLEERETGWGKKKKKIVVATLVEAPTVQSALIALDPATGEIRAMQGGYDYHMTQFNRATQAKRQAGSSIKPFVYTAAVERGRTEVDIVVDGPISVPTAGGVWSPHNYKGEFAGAVTLRTALAKSLNTVSVRLALEAGVPNVIEYMRKMGLEKSVIPRHISISLGTPDVVPLEMTAAFASFPAGGRRVNPIFITKISSHDGTVLEESHSGLGEQVMSPETAYIMADMMKAVVTNGTGRKALELGRPVGGKTGTSNDFRDAWFVAYTADLVCGVWVGRDNFKPIGGDTTGGNTAAPIWLDFMRAAHPRTPPRDFAVPPGIVFIRMNGASGNRARPGEWGSVLIPFKQGTVPVRFFEGTDDRFSEEDIPSSQPVGPDSQPASSPASAPASAPTSFPASVPTSQEAED
jgi:penicillin-binding protein 1A